MNIAADDITHREQQLLARRAARRRQLQLGAGVLGLCLAVGYGGYWWLTGRYLESTDDAYVRADWVPVSARINGYVAQVLVADDQPVKAGDVLVRIDDRDYQARLAAATASVAEADASVQAAQASLTVAHERVAEQQAAIAQAAALAEGASAEARRAGLDRQRYQGLVRDQAASAQRLESAESSFAQARAALQAAQARQHQQDLALNVARSREQLAQAAVQQQLARQAQARAQLALARNALEDTLVRAPIDGVVGQRKVRERQYLAPGLPLLAVVPVQQAYVVANFKETQLQHMRPGQSVELRVDSFGGQRLHGHVASFSPGSGAVFALLPSDNATGNFTKIVQRFPVRILLDKAADGAPILPGMSVVATVDTRDER
ncbi:HlyD family secretion protein [Pseudomonas sp. App30]|uniref:HlyD family secretion protein n=1 Tax=Pseudomonas sp. App30 TaxID=3068990 RepID=UPI003A8011C9